VTCAFAAVASRQVLKHATSRTEEARPQMRTSFHHQPEAQHPNFPLSASWQAITPYLGHKQTSGFS
jgi:hypothetical protein